MKRGDHIKVKRPLGYYHHGIYIGDEKVIHYSGEPDSKRSAEIKIDQLEGFADNSRVETVLYRNEFPPDETIKRAISRFGESDYNLIFNNCEHFAVWCKTGEHMSKQVDNAFLVAGYMLDVAGEMDLPTIELDIDDWVKQGLKNGLYRIQGGAVIKQTGRKEIVYWLKRGQVFFKENTEGFLSHTGALLSIFGFGLMQINFFVVFKKLTRMEKNIDLIAEQLSKVKDILVEVHRRQIRSLLANALSGCKLAHEAARMNDQLAAKHQMVLAKGKLSDAEIFFKDELKRIDPFEKNFWLLFELICQIKLAYVRVHVFLRDFELGKEELERLREWIDFLSLKCLWKNTSDKETVNCKYDSINMVLAMHDVVAHYLNEIESIEETDANIPYKEFMEKQNG